MPKNFWEKLCKLFTLSCCVKDNHVLDEDTSSSPSFDQDTCLLYDYKIDCLILILNEAKKLLEARGNLFLLPNDIILDILERLDFKSAVQCRRVCKSFYEMTSTPSFIATHLIDRDRPIHVFQYDPISTVSHDHNGNYTYHIVLDFIQDLDRSWMQQRTTIPITLKYPPKHKHHNPRLIGSYNGLLLFRPDLNICNSLFIFNCITREEVLVTAPELYEDSGLYFHTPTSEYRILYMLSNLGDPLCKFFVLSLSSKLCREISGYAKAPRTCKPPVILNSRLHWMASIPGVNICSCRDSTSCSESILVFNMISEDFITMPHPGSQCISKERHGINMQLSEIAGHLCLGDTSMDTATLNVWVLEDYKQQVWVKRYTKDITPWQMRRINIPVDSHCKPFFEVLKSHNDELHLLQLGCRRIYHSNGKAHKVGEQYKDCVDSVVVHNKSIASLNTDRLVSWEEPINLIT